MQGDDHIIPCYVLNRLVPFHIIDVGTKRSFILLIGEGETACSAP